MDRAHELTLVEALRTGDGADEAFDEVYAAFHGRLLTFLTRLSSRRDVAEDLLEEVWLRLVTHGQRLQPDTHLGPWLFTVARRLHASYCRSRSMADAHTGEMLSLWPAGTTLPSPLEALVATEAQRTVARALARLPLPYREALVLVEMEGWRPTEAAAICGIGADAMRQRLSRARQRLARELTSGDVAAVGDSVCDASIGRVIPW